MRFRIWTYDGNQIRVTLGAWSTIESDGIQKIHLLEPGGTTLEISGFDRYFCDGRFLGGVNDADTPGLLRAQTWRIDGGRARLLDDPILIYRSGEKRGTLVPDEVAREIGIR